MTSPSYPLTLDLPDAGWWSSAAARWPPAGPRASSRPAPSWTSSRPSSARTCRTGAAGRLAWHARDYVAGDLARAGSPPGSCTPPQATASSTRRSPAKPMPPASGACVPMLRMPPRRGRQQWPAAPLAQPAGGSPSPSRPAATHAAPPRCGTPSWPPSTAAPSLSAASGLSGRAGARPRAVGRVALVGGGPGADDLITVRGRALLAAADVIVTDRLGSAGLLGPWARTSR